LKGLQTPAFSPSFISSHRSSTTFTRSCSSLKTKSSEKKQPDVIISQRKDRRIDSRKETPNLDDNFTVPRQFSHLFSSTFPLLSRYIYSASASSSSFSSSSSVHRPVYSSTSPMFYSSPLFRSNYSSFSKEQPKANKNDKLFKVPFSSSSRFSQNPLVEEKIEMKQNNSELDKNRLVTSDPYLKKANDGICGTSGKLTSLTSLKSSSPIKSPVVESNESSDKRLYLMSSGPLVSVIPFIKQTKITAIDSVVQKCAIDEEEVI
jgi:hypothetical protein